MLDGLRDGVIVANYARNTSYPLAEALQGAGYLRKYVTSVYYKPDTVAGRALRALATRVSGADLKRLLNRRTDGVPDDRVASVPVPELVEQAVSRAMTRMGRDHRSAVYLKCEAFDWYVARRHVEPCAIFHGYEQCALF